MNDTQKEILLLARAGYPILYLLSPEEGRALRLLRETAKNLKLPLDVWSRTEGYKFARRGDEQPVASEGDAATRDPLTALDLVISSDERKIVVLKDFHFHLKDPAVVRRLRDFVALPNFITKRAPLVILSPCLYIPEELEKEVTLLDLPLPNQEELAALLDKIVKKHPVLGVEGAMSEDVREKLVLGAVGLSEDEARRLFIKIFFARPRFTEKDLGLVVREKKQIIKKSEFLDFHDAPEGMGSIGGLDELKSWLDNRRRAFGEEARRFGLPQPKGLLLLGVQGCGKSLTAKAVANLWRLPLLRLDMGAVFGSESGSPEENLRKATRVAESLAPVVLWLDEIEKAFGETHEGSSGRVFGSFLTWMQEKEKPVFIVATANDISSLPPELLRKGRFDEIFFIDLPSPAEREKILSVHISKRGRNPEDFDLVGLAADTDGFSGAEMEEAIISAMYASFTAKSKLTDIEIRQAVGETVPLSVTQEEQIKELREWAKERARPASLDTRILDLFEETTKRDAEEG